MLNIDKDINKLIELLDNDNRIIELKKYKDILLNDKDFLEMINKIKELDIYSEEYKELKLKLFENANFREYKHLENEINLLILEINKRLKTLTKKTRVCNHASN